MKRNELTNKERSDPDLIETIKRSNLISTALLTATRKTERISPIMA